MMLALGSVIPLIARTVWEGIPSASRREGWFRIPNAGRHGYVTWCNELATAPTLGA
jgi:hypothetical protein